MRYRKVWGVNGDTREYVDDILISGTEPHREDAAFYMADIEQHYGNPIISPVDGSVISSRSQLREHNARHNVRQNGDISTADHIRTTNKRFEYKPDPSISFNWTDYR